MLMASTEMMENSEQLLQAATKYGYFENVAGFSTPVNEFETTVQGACGDEDMELEKTIDLLQTRPLRQ